MRPNSCCKEGVVCLREAVWAVQCEDHSAQNLGRGPHRLADLVGLVLSLVGTPGLRSWWEWGVMFQKHDQPACCHGASRKLGAGRGWWPGDGETDGHMRYRL